MAHDCNNLLSVMVNGLGILQRRLVAPEDVRILDAMTRAASRGATLTQQWLSFARRQPRKQDNLNLNDVTGSFEAVLRHASRGSVEFERELAAQLPRVRIDAAQLEASLLNLIVNARDATPDGGTISLRTVVVELRAGEVSMLPERRSVMVDVADTGEGMTSDTMDRAMEPFFTARPVGKGTGLGLCQAYGLAQQSNGDLVLRSVVGEGTQVAFYFPPLSEKDQPAAASALPVAEDEKSGLDEFSFIAKRYTLAQILKELRAAP